MSRGPGIMQREILRRARGAFTVRDIAQKLYVKIDDSKLGGVRRAVRSLEAKGYLIREPGQGCYRKQEKPQAPPKRREWRRVPAPIRNNGFQWDKRQAEAEREAETTLGARRPQDSGKIDYTIGEIGAAEAAEFIRRYEWLGTVGNPVARYCARNEYGEAAAVAILSAPVNVQAAGICRPLNPRNLSDEDRAYLATVACLERGACAHWAHPHTASWFIPKVLELARAEHGWKIFYAYSDPEAGEIGTIYQACNWLYIGAGAGRGSRGPRSKFRHSDWPRTTLHGGGKWIGERAFYQRGLSVADVGRRNGLGRLSAARPWEMIDDLDKGKYVKFVGNKGERRALMKALRYPVLPYPKRSSGKPDART
jgi:hypothetical protein